MQWRQQFHRNLRCLNLTEVTYPRQLAAFGRDLAVVFASLVPVLFSFPPYYLRDLPEITLPLYVAVRQASTASPVNGVRIA